MIQQTLNVLMKAAIIGGLFIVIGACNIAGTDSEGTKVIISDKAAANFDYFHYKGQDDFYTNNPLPGEDYFYNPILPGWYSDPSICTDGEYYFLVTSSFSYFPGVPLFYSKDMVNWRQAGHVLDRKSQLELDGQRVSEGIFAPAISYNPYNETYYMITTNIRKGNFFVKTRNPFGKWSDPVWLPDVKGIDPSFFFDDDGKAYIVNNDAPDGDVLYAGHRAIRIHEFDVAKEETIGESKMLVNGGVNIEEKPVWIEGPHLYKINGEYFLMCAEGGTSVDHREVIFKGDSPMGKFKPWKDNPILTQRHLDPNRRMPVTSAGHADIIEDKNGKWWSVFLACRPINGEFENLGRETFMMPVRWSDDGFPYMTKGNELIPMIVRKKGVERKDSITFGNFEMNDDFNSPNLGHEWMTLRNPADELYSLTENPGFLSLEFSDVKTTERKTPAFVCRRIQHHKFECSAKLFFKPGNDNDAAGLLLFKDEAHQYFLSISKKGKKERVALEKISGEDTEVLAASLINSEDNPITFKIHSRGKLWDFYFSLGDNEPELFIGDVDAHYLSTDNSWGFTGTTIGMYATKNN